MKNKIVAVATMSIIVCGSVLNNGYAQQSQAGGASQPQPAVPVAKPTQPTANRSMQVDPEKFARWQKLNKPVNDALRRADILYTSNDLAGAERAAREAIALSGSFAPSAPIRARRLIGQIRLKQGQYKEALQLFEADWEEGSDARLDLDMALCYARLGNSRMARQFYSEQNILRYNSFATARDLPGTRTPQTLEASILLARGSDSYTRSREKEAFENFTAALKIVPNNGFAAYKAGKALYYLNRRDEAGPYFVKAVQNGHGEFVDEARRYVPAAMQDQIANVPKSTRQTLPKAQSRP